MIDINYVDTVRRMAQDVVDREEALEYVPAGNCFKARPVKNKGWKNANNHENFGKFRPEFLSPHNYEWKPKNSRHRNRSSIRKPSWLDEDLEHEETLLGAEA